MNQALLEVGLASSFETIGSDINHSAQQFKLTNSLSTPPGPSGDDVKNALVWASKVRVRFATGLAGIR